MRAERRLLDTHMTDRTYSVALSDGSNLHQSLLGNYSHWEALSETGQALLGTHTGSSAALLTTGLSTEHSGMLERGSSLSNRLFSAQYSADIGRLQLTGQVGPRMQTVVSNQFLASVLHRHAWPAYLLWAPLNTCSARPFAVQCKQS